MDNDPRIFLENKFSHEWTVVCICGKQKQEREREKQNNWYFFHLILDKIFFTFENQNLLLSRDWQKFKSRANVEKKNKYVTEVSVISLPHTTVRLETEAIFLFRVFGQDTCQQLPPTLHSTASSLSLFSAWSLCIPFHSWNGKYILLGSSSTWSNVADIFLPFSFGFVCRRSSVSSLETVIWTQWSLETKNTWIFVDKSSKIFSFYPFKNDLQRILSSIWKIFGNLSSN